MHNVTLLILKLHRTHIFHYSPYHFPQFKTPSFSLYNSHIAFSLYTPVAHTQRQGRKSYFAMKSKTHSHNGNGNATDSGASSPPTPPRPPRRHSNISHCRRRPRLKAFSQTKKLASIAAGTIDRRFI